MLKKREISVVLFVAAISIMIMLVASLSAQNRIRHWQDTFTTSSEKPAHIASVLMHEYIRLRNAVSDYHSGDGQLSKEELMQRLDVYLSQIKLLDVQKERFLQSPHTFKIKNLPTDSHTPVLAESVQTLIAIGEPYLLKIRGLLEKGEADDQYVHIRIDEILRHFSKPLGLLTIHASERDRYQDHIQVELSEQLRRQLWLAYLSIGLGIGLAAFALIRRWLDKATSATNLQNMNTRLRVKIRESQRLSAELQFQARHDLLSGLHNRLGFNVELETILNQRVGNHGLCFIDLDLFKIVNDTCGHAAGDALIQQVANLLLSRVSVGSLVGRFGGDEFLILTPDCEASEFEAMIEECCNELRPFNFEFEGQQFAVTGSFGATHFDANEHSLQSLMVVVDSACYEAKRAGGGRVHFYTDYKQTVDERLDDINWVNRIQKALSQDEFCLYKQKIASFSEGASSASDSWEILIRMIDSDGALLSPGHLLEVAERYGLSSRIDRWVVKSVFEWLKLNAGLLEVDHLNINLSGRSVGDPKFLYFIEQMTEKLQVDTSLVCFEITETAIVGNNAQSFLIKLKSMGFQLALDDFGSGFSSFGYLESLPVDYIKIDGMFVQDIDTNETHREFVKAISTVGKVMGKTVVAEFVQNQASLDILKALDVGFGQGYFIGYPEALEDYLGELEHESTVLRDIA